eukprot:6012408-Amphidinium_carterae.1
MQEQVSVCVVSFAVLTSGVAACYGDQCGRGGHDHHRFEAEHMDFQGCGQSFLSCVSLHVVIVLDITLYTTRGNVLLPMWVVCPSATVKEIEGCIFWRQWSRSKTVQISHTPAVFVRGSFLWHGWLGMDDTSLDHSWC